MIRIGCRAHDYGRHTPAALADTLHAHGYTAAQLAMPRGILGIDSFADITQAQLEDIRTAFDAAGVEITVLSCYQDLTAPDADARRAGRHAARARLHRRPAGHAPGHPWH